MTNKTPIINDPTEITENKNQLMFPKLLLASSRLAAASD